MAVPNLTANGICLKHNSFGCVEQVFDNVAKGRLCFFVGAALSKRHPSCLPTGDELRNWVLTALAAGAPGAFIDHVATVVTNKTDVLPASVRGLARLQLEHLLLVVSEPAVAEPGQLAQGLEILDVTRADPWGRQPNWNHAVLGLLLVTGRVPAVVTVNFDRLIEESVDGVPADGVLKLHGDIRRPDSLRARLTQVTSPLSGTQRHGLDDLLTNHPFCFAGYSGTDADIIPAIRDSRSTWDIYWLLRPKPTAREDAARVQGLLDRRDHLLHPIVYDIDTFFDALAERVRLHPAIADTQVAELVHMCGQHWAEWGRRFEPWQRRFAVARIYQELGARQQEAFYFRAAIIRSSSQSRLARSLHAYAMAHLGMRHMARAAMGLAAAFAASPRHDWEARALSMRDMGDLAYRAARRTRGGRTSRFPLAFANRAVLHLAECALSAAVHTASSASVFDPRQQYQQRALLGLAFSHRGKIARERELYAKAEGFFAQALQLADANEDGRNYWLEAEVRLHRSIERMCAGRIDDGLQDLALAQEMFERLGHAEGLTRVAKTRATLAAGDTP